MKSLTNKRLLLAPLFVVFVWVLELIYNISQYVSDSYMDLYFINAILIGYAVYNYIKFTLINEEFFNSLSGCEDDNEMM